MDIWNLGYFEIWMLTGVVAAACALGLDKRTSPFELLWIVLAGPIFPAGYMLAILWGVTRLLPDLVKAKLIEEIDCLEGIIKIQQELIENQQAIIKTDEVQAILKDFKK